MTRKEEKNLYLNDAQFYDLDNREVLKLDIPFFLRKAAEIGGDILELACGTGRVTIPLAEAGHSVWAVELSETMVRRFKEKMADLPDETTARIHLNQGNMTDFYLDRKFPQILLPCRAFQLLLEQELEIACLKNIRDHMEDDGTFIIDFGYFIQDKEREQNWVNPEECFDYENIHPTEGYKVRRTHIKKEIDCVRQVIYPLKIYRIIHKDGSRETVTKRAPWKYFFPDQARGLLTAVGFRIVEELGGYKGEALGSGTELIFVCKKNTGEWKHGC